MVQEKMNDVLEKNKGYQTLTQISKILSGEETLMVGISENLSLGNLAYFKYAPINSVDVERSFSIFKVLLADNRKSFQFENLKKNILLCSAISKVKMSISLKYLKLKYFVNCFL